MPNIKAAEKWVRQSEKRTKRNLDTKTRLKTLVKKARASGEAPAVRTAEAQLDKAASRGIIHPNKAARKKSRLAAALKKAQALGHTGEAAVRAAAKAKSGRR